MTPQAFGLHLTSSEIDDYVYFWKCVCQLGVMDKYNLWVDYKTSESITWEVIDNVVLPSEVTVPEPDYDTIVNAYVDGANSVFPLVKLWSSRAMNAYASVTRLERNAGTEIRMLGSSTSFLLQVLIFLIRWAPGVALLGNALVLCATYALIHNDKKIRDDDEGDMPRCRKNQDEKLSS